MIVSIQFYNENVQFLPMWCIKGILYDRGGKIMKKLRQIIAICFIVIAIVAVKIPALGSGRFFWDYWIRYLKGEYETNVLVTEATDDRCGTLTAYCDGKYYYFDKRKSAICDLKTGNALVVVEDVPWQILVSEKYIYYTTKNAIYQYSYQGKEVAKQEFLSQEWPEGMCLIGDNLYCESTGYDEETTELVQSFCVLDAENISKCGKIHKNEGEWERILNCNDPVIGGIADLYMLDMGDFTLVVEGDPDIMEIVCTEQTVKIYLKEIERYGLFSKQTGERMCSFGEQDIMAINDDGIYYSAAHLIETGCLKGKKNWEKIEEEVEPTLSRAHMKLDGSTWIILRERYTAGSSGVCPEGSVGEYVNGNITYIDLQTNSVSNSIPTKRQVVYFDKDQYAVLDRGTLIFHQSDNDEEIREHEIEKYQLRKDYTFESCYGKLFIFCEKQLLDVIDV